jgi:hypothetical protein
VVQARRRETALTYDRAVTLFVVGFMLTVAVVFAVQTVRALL